MAHLLEIYSRMTGLRINPMPIESQHFPIGSKKYVLFITGTGMPAKNYSYFPSVISFVREFLHKSGYDIVQAGDAENPRIGADIDICGKTSIKQFIHVVKNADLVVCGDTSALHIAGAFDKKIVSLFSITHPYVSGAFFGKPENQIYLVPDRDWKPSFNPNDSSSIINSIPPEKVVGAIGELLQIDMPRFNTLFVGGGFMKTCIEIIPNMDMPPNFYPNAPIQVRLDKGGTAQKAISILSQRQGILVTTDALPLEAILAVKKNLLMVVIIIEKGTSPDFPLALKKNGIPVTLASFLTEEELNEKKLDYADIAVIKRETPPTFASLGIKVNSSTKFSTYRRILSDGRLFLSHGHVLANKSIDNTAQSEDTILDNEEFWKGSEFYHIYNYA